MVKEFIWEMLLFSEYHVSGYAHEFNHVEFRAGRWKSKVCGGKGWLVT